MNLDLIRENALAARGSAISIIEELNRHDPPDPIPDPEPTADPEPEEEKSEANYLVVGKDAASPGGIAEIEILGQTDVEVQGFGMYFGCPRELKLLGKEVTEELKALIDLPNPHFMATQSLEPGGQTEFIACFTAFFNFVTADTPTGDGRKIMGIRLPSLTPLMRLRFQVPETATPGHRNALGVD